MAIYGKRKTRNTFDLAEAIALHKLGDGYALSKDGSLSIGFKVHLLPLNGLDAGDIMIFDPAESGHDLNGLLQRAIKGLDPGTIFHQQDIVFEDKGYELPNNDDFLSSSVRKNYSVRKIMNNVTYFFITKKGLLFKGDKFDVNNHKIQRFIESVNIFQAAIDIFKPVKMETEDWVNYFESFFACDFSDTPNKAVENCIDFRQREFGQYDLRGYSLTGDLTTPVLLGRLENPERSNESNLRFNSWIYPVFWKVPCYKVVNNIIVREDPVKLQGEAGKYVSRLGLMKSLNPGIMASSTEYIEYAKDDDYTPVMHHFSVFFFFLKEGDTKLLEASIDKAFHRINAKPQKITVDLEETFMGTIGSCSSTLSYPCQLSLSFLDEAVCFSNVEGSYTQFQNGIVLSDTKGSPVIVDVLFEPAANDTISNYNFTAFGPSGTGKSVFTNKFISSYVPLDVFFFIIDIGGSYKTLTSLYGQRAKYIELKRDTNDFSTNPFLIDMIDPGNDPNGYLADKFEILVNLLFIAWDPNNQENVRRETTTQSLIKLLRDFYTRRFLEQQQFVCFDDFFKFVVEKSKLSEKERDPFFDFASFIHIMEQYTIGQPNGLLLNGKENIMDIRGLSMIVFELEAIAEKSKTIMRLITYMLISMGIDIIQNAPHRMKFLWLDEAWQLLDNEDFGPFIKKQFKTIRKKGGGVGVITQNVDDILSTAYGESIIASSDSLVFLSQEGKENLVAKYQNQLSLSDKALSLILSMKKKNHEVTIVQKGNASIYGVLLSPEELATFTTTKTEIIKRDRLIDKNHGNVKLGIEEYVAQN